MVAIRAGFLSDELKEEKKDKGHNFIVLPPSPGSARLGSDLARAFGQKARLGSARPIFQKARIQKFLLTRAFLPLMKKITGIALF